NMAEIRTINQSLMRGGPNIQVFYSFNPPKSQRNWTNIEVENQKLRKRAYVHSSDYRSVPKEWLGEDFLEEAEYLKQ
ncbi:hypothetical protein QP202_25335, partial [Escherichia coli]|nr:hypothetical protein [Escherichia coli]